MKKTCTLIAATSIIAFLALITVFGASIPAANASFIDAEWHVTVSGLVVNPLDLTLADLAAMPQTTVNASLYCVDAPNIAIAEGRWTGVKLSFLIDEAGVMPNAYKVAFFAKDGYSTDLILETARSGDIILAYKLNGETLSETLRLVVPGRWGYKWISQVSNIELVDYDFKGKWESQGYSDDAIVQAGGSTSQWPSLFPNTNSSLLPPSNSTTSPSPSPTASNSSVAVPSQSQSAGSKPETQSSEPSSTSWIAVVVLLTFVGVASLAFFIRRKK